MSEIVPPTTRPIDCPDGLGRFITMDLWCWDSFEWLKTNCPLSTSYMLQDAWNLAKDRVCDQDDDSQDALFEEFAACLGSHLYWTMTDFYPEMRRPHNDNKFSAKTTRDIFGAIIKTKGKGTRTKYKKVEHFERMGCGSTEMLFGNRQCFRLYTTLIPYVFMTETANDNPLPVS